MPKNEGKEYKDVFDNGPWILRAISSLVEFISGAFVPRKPFVN